MPLERGVAGQRESWTSVTMQLFRVHLDLLSCLLSRQHRSQRVMPGRGLTVGDSLILLSSLPVSLPLGLERLIKGQGDLLAKGNGPS
jgi:hypothetical protein